MVEPQTRLGAAFFARPSTEVAPDLVGKLLVRVDEGLVARVVETEAYLQEDAACHAHRARTERNDPLWRRGGHAYVYFTYGMHWCLNTATGPAGHAQGVLLRAAEPLEGLALMRARRGERVPDRDLLRGPARLAQAFGLDGSWSGSDLCAAGSLLQLHDDGTRLELEVTPRTGVAAAADLPWRWAAAGSRWASPYKRHPKAPAAGPARRAGAGQPPG